MQLIKKINYQLQNVVIILVSLAKKLINLGKCEYEKNEFDLKGQIWSAKSVSENWK